MQPEPLITLRREASDYEGSSLDHDLHREVEGEVRCDRGTRALYATDSSNYRQLPIGVVVPRTADAVVAAIAVCHRHGVPVLLRGGGTSLAGQTCNHAVVIDVSRHLARCEIDAVTGIAHVEPGLVLDSLRNAARAVGWDFGPDPSTHDRCTIGGMLGNDSCGVHSVFSEFYGPGPRTSDHVIELDALTYDGLRVRARATDETELRRIRDGGGRVAEIYARMFALRDRYAELIRARFPDMPRRVSGYNLPALLPENGAHVGRALVGSEATCVTILGATLQLVRAKPARALCVLGFSDIYQAADAVPEVRKLKPVGLEAIDHVLVARVKQMHKGEEAVKLLPEGQGWLIAEFGAETTEEARAQAERAKQLAPGRANAFDHKDVEEQLWNLREAALAVTAYEPGKPDTYEGWEDSAVPVPHLGNYLRDLHALYHQYGYHGALYGHFGQGCVHTRIDFDLRHPAGVERYKQFTGDAAKLVVAHGGSLSGEHGDGQSRADLHEVMFGPELVQAFGEFKSIWDPEQRMNPGKIAYPNPRTSHLRLADYDPHPGEIQLSHGDDGKDFGHAALRCVGVGKCRKHEGGTMCPSYMVTLDERHSTRGRAHMLYEMLLGDAIQDGWRSESVREALDLCLACKACKHECPVNVDMASYKAEFMSHHYEHRLRPRSHYVFGFLHRWLTLGRPLAPLANAFSGTRLAKWLAGISPERQIPKLARRSFRRSWQRPAAASYHAPRVILWADTFNDAFYPDVLHSASHVLSAAGYAVDVPRVRLCCGRPMFELGWIDQTRRLWEHTFTELEDAIRDGTPIVGIEPTCTAMFRDEVKSLFPGDPRAEAISKQTVTIGELLKNWEPPRMPNRHAIFHRHCHEAAVLDPEAEIDLLRRAGVDVHVLDSGCCGMAGSFGFERDKYELSVALAERVLLPAIRAEPDALVVTDGFSCREQVRQLSGVRARHVAEVIAEMRVLM